MFPSKALSCEPSFRTPGTTSSLIGAVASLTVKSHLLFSFLLFSSRIFSFLSSPPYLYPPYCSPPCPLSCLPFCRRRRRRASLRPPRCRGHAPLLGGPSCSRHRSSLPGRHPCPCPRPHRYCARQTAANPRSSDRRPLRRHFRANLTAAGTCCPAAGGAAAAAAGGANRHHHPRRPLSLPASPCLRRPRRPRAEEGEGAACRLRWHRCWPFLPPLPFLPLLLLLLLLVVPVVLQRPGGAPRDVLVDETRARGWRCTSRAPPGHVPVSSRAAGGVAADSGRVEGGGGGR